MAYTTKGALDRQKAVTVKSKEKNNDVRLQLFAEDWRVWDAVRKKALTHRALAE